MEYIEVYFKLNPLLPAREIVYAELGELGFEAFEDADDGVKAYIQQKDFDENSLDAISVYQMAEQEIAVEINVIENQNWNALWESNFDPIIVNTQCVIRAPFHSKPAVEFDVIISPQMSFGTGHHETTLLMSQELFNLNLKKQSILDMGCGTGVLAILAKKLDAAKVLAIDIEEGAYLNTIDNCKLNNTKSIIVEKGDSKLLGDSLFHVILANINKNILLEDVKTYAKCLSKGGKLLLSGFFTTDVDELKNKSFKFGLKFVEVKEKNNWALLLLEKI